MYSLHIDTARTWRGGQNQVLLTVLGLRAQGHRTLLVAHPDGELKRRAAEGLDLVSLAPQHEVDLAAAWRLARIIRRERPDILHAHDPHAVSMAAWALSLAVGRNPPPLVASRRVDFPLRRNAFSRWKYGQVTRFLCASDMIRRLLVSQGIDAAKAVTVHEGIDLQRIAAVPRLDVHTELHLPHGAPVIGNIAALVPHKGQRYLVEAHHRVIEREPDTRLVIFGEGELRSSLERQIRDQSLERHVLLAGFRADVVGFLKSFDIFVLSSVMEGLGTSLLDAMACGKPIVASAVGGIPEAVENGVTGLLVPERDPKALATALVGLLRDAPRRAAFAAAGFERVRREFSAERMVARTLEVYEQLVDTGP